MFIAPLTFLLLTTFIDLSPSQEWLQVKKRAERSFFVIFLIQIRLVLSLLIGTLVSAGVVKGRKIVRILWRVTNFVVRENFFFRVCALSAF